MTFRPDPSPPETSARATGTAANSQSREQEAPTQPHRGDEQAPRARLVRAARRARYNAPRVIATPSSQARRDGQEPRFARKFACRRRSLCWETRGPCNRNGDQTRTRAPEPARSSTASTASSRRSRSSTCGARRRACEIRPMRPTALFGLRQLLGHLAEPRHLLSQRIAAESLHQAEVVDHRSRAHQQPAEFCARFDRVKRRLLTVN